MSTASHAINTVAEINMFIMMFTFVFSLSS